MVLIVNIPQLGDGQKRPKHRILSRSQMRGRTNQRAKWDGGAA